MGPQAALHKRGKQHEIHAEQRRRDGPVDNAGQRFGVEQPHAARDFAKVHLAVFAEQGIDVVIAQRAAGQPIIHIGIGPEFCDDDIDLRRVEIPAKRAGDDSPEQQPEAVKAPCLQRAALARRDARRVESEIDAAIGERADNEHRKKAGAAARLAQARRQSPRAADSGDDSSRVGARIAIVFGEPSKERRRAVGAADDRLDERKRQSPGEGRQRERIGLHEGEKGPLAQRRGQDKQQEHKDAAVDGAFDGAGAPMAVSGDKGRRLAADEVKRQSRHVVDDRL